MRGRKVVVVLVGVTLISVWGLTPGIAGVSPHTEISVTPTSTAATFLPLILIPPSARKFCASLGRLSFAVKPRLRGAGGRLRLTGAPGRRI